MIAADDGLEEIDLATGGTLWSKFGGRAGVEELQRSPTRLSAIVATGAKVERWTWDLPSRRLLDRLVRTTTWGSDYGFAAPAVTALAADGTILHLGRDGDDYFDCVTPIDGPEIVRPLDDFAEFTIDGDCSALTRETMTGVEITLRNAEHAPVAVITFPDASYGGFRAFRGVATAFADGRVVAIDLRTQAVMVNLRTR